MQRRDFLVTGTIAAAGLAASQLPRGLISRSQDTHIDKIPVRVAGASARRGHKIRSTEFPTIEKRLQRDVVIVGGGIAGLSAAWKLQKLGIDDLLLLELEGSVGGNSSSRRNAISAYPLGAHYLPLPGPDAVDVRELLSELGVITGHDAAGRPRYEERYLCQAPEERLFINGRWQDGIVPNFGVPENDLDQIKRFLELMRSFKRRSRADSAALFTIPVRKSSEELHALDQQTMAQYLQLQGLNSSYLRWYVDYCCRDDYGTSIGDVSAWAGIHYFASRGVDAADIDDYTVLTWPEGNGWLAQRLGEPIADRTIANAIVRRIDPREGTVLYEDALTGEGVEVRARAIVYAAPRFTAPYVIAGVTDEARSLTYAPWLVANLSLSKVPADSAHGFAWDNVLYGRSSLGYVHANHQLLEFAPGKHVITYYLPLADHDAANARRRLYETSPEFWREQIVSELRIAHPDIVRLIEDIELWYWGHAMLRPLPGVIWNDTLRLSQRLEKLIFAHSDMSGFSIFEEAQYHGINAANEVRKLFA